MAHHEYGYQRGIAETLEGLAGVATAKSASKRAATLFGAAEALRTAIQVPRLPSERARYDPMIKEIRSQLKAAEFSAAWSAGMEMLPSGLEKVIAYALEPEDAPAPLAGTQSGIGLTAREGEILRLLAQGLTDAQIAQKLFISPRTVNAHLTSVYGKLGVNSRSAATRFAVENGLV